jgi:hypothetical protein
LAAKDSDLVAEYEDLDLFGSVSAQRQHQQLEDAPQRQVGKRPERDR